MAQTAQIGGQIRLDQSLNARASRSREHLVASKISDPAHGQWSAYNQTRATRKRRTWPPSPVVEGEAASLAKEKDPPQPLGDSDRGETPLRGSIDQLPILLEANIEAGAKNSSWTSSNKQQRRGSFESARTDAPINPRGRAPAPYHFTTVHQKHNDLPFGQPSAAEKANNPTFSRTSPSSALRGQGRPRDAPGAVKHPAKEPEAPIRNPSVHLQDEKSRVQAFSRTQTWHSTSQPSTQPAKHLEYPSSRRGSDGSASIVQPRPGHIKRGCHRLNISLQGSHSALQSPVSTPPASSHAAPDYVSAARGSPRSPHSNLQTAAHLGKPPSSPPRSPRHNWTAPNSPFNSRPGSRPNSRPPSPPADQKPTSFSTAAFDARAHRTSRLAVPTTLSDEPKHFDKSSPHGLPYPVDDELVMPSEQVHISQVEQLTGRPFLKAPSLRPQMMQRHSYDSSLPTMKTSSAIKDSPDSPKTPASPTMTKYRNPPSCPRADAVRGHDDWYTSRDRSEMNICPSCFQSTFWGTPFEHHLKSAGRGTSSKIKCDFASPWMRLAWRLTQAQQRANLNLLVSLARIQHGRQSCPGEKDSMVDWYAITDRKGRQIKYFDVCPADLVKIEALMPAIADLFEISERSSGKRRQCDLHEKSPRNDIYMDKLAEIHEKAWQDRRELDVEGFVDLVRHKAGMLACERDRVIEDGQFYYMRELPEFTVCEDCHHSIIMPARENGVALALQFNRTPQAVPSPWQESSKREQTVPASCQLWSPRMRRVLRRAMDKNDYEYLAQRARERKEVQEEHLARKSAIKRELKRESGHDARSTERIANLEADLDDEEAYWKKWQ